MSDVKKKLSLLKVERRIKGLKGIKNVSLLIDKPKEIAWYAGELNLIDNQIPCSYRFPVDVDTKELALAIEMLVGQASHFIIVLWEQSPIYVFFQLESWEDFLSSFYTEFTSRDMSLFFQDKEKILDVFLEEYEIEVKIFDKNIKNDLHL